MMFEERSLVSASFDTVILYSEHPYHAFDHDRVRSIRITFYGTQLSSHYH